MWVRCATAGIVLFATSCISTPVAFTGSDAASDGGDAAETGGGADIAPELDADGMGAEVGTDAGRVDTGVDGGSPDANVDATLADVADLSVTDVPDLPDLADSDGASDLDPAPVTLSFQDGVAPRPTYFGTRDAHLRLASPDSNYGTLADMEVDTDFMVNLFAWDLSAIPAGATVVSVELQLTSTSNPSSTAYDVLPVNVGWSESEATWNVREAGSGWAQPGCFGAADRGPEVFGQIDSDASDAVLVVSSSPSLVARVQGWVDDPSTNHGIVVQGSPTTTDGLHLWSREHTAAGARPSITVEFLAP